MIRALTIWVRVRLAEAGERVRELFRRAVRKLVELVLTDIDLMARLRDATATAAFEEKHLHDAAGYKTRLALHRAMLKAPFLAASVQASGNPSKESKPYQVTSGRASAK